MSNQDLNETEEQLNIDEQEESNSSSPSGISLFFDRIKTWLNTQNKTMVYGVSALLLIAIGFVCYRQFYQQPRERKALAAIYKNQNLFDVDSFRMVLKDAPKLADKYSGTKAGELAAFMAGRSYMATGDFKNAIKYLEDVDFKDNVMKYQVMGLLGDAYVESKDLDKGLKQYLKAAKAATTDFAAVYWYLKAGRVCEKKNDWKQALEIYQTIKKDYSLDEGAQEITKRIGKAQAKLGEY